MTSVLPARSGAAAGALRILQLVLLSISGTAAAHGQTRAPSDLAHWESIKPLFGRVERVAAGSEPADEIATGWGCHFFKAEAGVVFVPFTIEVPAGTFSSFPLAMYVRVVARGAPAPAPGPRDALAQYPFEDAAIVEQPGDGRISRGFSAPPGKYDLYIGLADRADPSVPDPKAVVIKREIDVPAIGPGLDVSSLVIVEKIEVDPRGRRLDYEEQLDEPYALWGSKLTPALRRAFRRGEHLSVTFLVYGAEPAPDGALDVEVDYSFYRRTPAGEQFFTRTRPELLNRETLGPGFDQGAGDLAVAGRQVPLATFEDGSYRLEIRVTDKTGGRSLSRSLSFAVSGS